MATNFIGRSQGGGYAAKATEALGQAAASFSKQDRIIKPGEEGKDIGGALQGIAGGAATGAMIGGPWGAVIGGAVGLGGYLLS